MPGAALLAALLAPAILLFLFLLPAAFVVEAALLAGLTVAILTLLLLAGLAVAILALLRLTTLRALLALLAGIPILVVHGAVS